MNEEVIEHSEYVKKTNTEIRRLRMELEKERYHSSYQGAKASRIIGEREQLEHRITGLHIIYNTVIAGIVALAAFIIWYNK